MSWRAELSRSLPPLQFMFCAQFVLNLILLTTLRKWNKSLEGVLNIYHFHLLLLLLFLFLLLLLGLGRDGENGGGYLPESRERLGTHLTMETINLFTQAINNTSSSRPTLSEGGGTKQQSKYPNRRKNKATQ